MTTAEDFQVVATEHRYTGWAIDIRTDSVRMPDGTVVRRDVIAHPGAVGVVALDDDNRVVMVRQYRHPVGDFLLELPAGLLDVDGESVLAAAQRELYEEAAVTAHRWNVLVDLYTSPGMTDEAIRLFLARSLSSVAVPDRFRTEHEERTMTVERIDLHDLVTAALAGELTNGPAVAGVLAAASAAAAGWRGLRAVDAPWGARPVLAPAIEPI